MRNVILHVHLQHTVRLTMFKAILSSKSKAHSDCSCKESGRRELPESKFILSKSLNQHWSVNDGDLAYIPQVHPRADPRPTNKRSFSPRPWSWAPSHAMYSHENI